MILNKIVMTIITENEIVLILYEFPWRMELLQGKRRIELGIEGERKETTTTTTMKKKKRRRKHTIKRRGEDNTNAMMILSLRKCTNYSGDVARSYPSQLITLKIISADIKS